MEPDDKTPDALDTIEVAEAILEKAHANEASILKEVGDLQKEMNEIMGHYTKK